MKYYGLIFEYKDFKIKSSDEFKAFERKSLEKGEKSGKMVRCIKREKHMMNVRGKGR